MSHLLLLTGGARSGKSAYAQGRAEALDGPRRYLATCPRSDDGEMAERIAAHQAERAGRGWTTDEEPLDLAGALERAGAAAVVLVDCLTLWVSNLMFVAEQAGEGLTDAALTARAEAVLKAARRQGGTVIFVTNEVGGGIVPDNAVARRFRDLAGRANQRLAAGADEVVMTVCGLPLWLKGGEAGA